jgi:hypothetical protein
VLKQLGRHDHVADVHARRQAARDAGEHDGPHAEPLQQHRGRDGRRDLADARQHRDHRLAMQVADPEVAPGDAHALFVGHQREQRTQLLVHGATMAMGMRTTITYLMSTP